MMTAPNRSDFSVRDLAAILGVIAVLIRGLIAPGLMPDVQAAAEGDFRLVICSAGGLKTVALDAEGDKPAPDHQQAAELCPFTALPPLVTLAARDIPQNARQDPAIEPSPGKRLVSTTAVRRPSARAPPHLT